MSNKNLTRNIRFTPNINPYAAGSVLVEFGNTKVHVTVGVKDEVPDFLKGKNMGWLTAEYSMLPMATHTRNERERKGASGRTQEIQRFIGRSLRNCIDRSKMGERTFSVDCDVLVADGGTRVASISGACVALKLATQALLKKNKLTQDPMIMMIAAISVGLDESGNLLCDLNYEQDSKACVDMNIVMNDRGEFLEFLASTEGQRPMSLQQTQQLLTLGQQGIDVVLAKQKEILQGL